MSLEKPKRSDRKRVEMDTSDLALPKLHPARDSRYKAFVRSHPCAIRGMAGHVCHGRIEAAHIKTTGFAIKASDYATVPLCQRAHTMSGEGTVAQHASGWGAFMSRYDFNPWHVAFLLLEEWHKRECQ